MKARTNLSRARRAWPGRLTVHGSRTLRLIALCLSLAFAFAAVGLGTAAPAAKAAAAAPAAVAADQCGSPSPCAPITGAGSTWAYNAIHAWDANMAQFQIQVNYQPNGSSSGRTFFASGQSDFAASEIPYGVVDGANTDQPPTERGFAYIPDVAGGTTFMYNLQINGQRVTNLRLAGKTVADIFTNKVTFWDDPEIKADNPQLALPHLQITPVVRSDGSGATADFTQWMLATDPSAWQAYCTAVGRSPCTQTSTYPPQGGTAQIAQQGDPGVATYVAQASSNGAIGYVEYSWALQEGFPVAKLLNAAGFYTLPSPGHVAVSLLADQVDTTDTTNPSKYLTQDLSGVYTNMDPRNYELSAYSYLILPTDTKDGMSTTKGFTLGLYGSYLLCTGQSQVDVLGYSALPINLVQAGFAQLQKVPGSTVPTQSTAQIAQCNNPTFSTDGTNTLAKNDPQPLACDKQGATQCAQGVAEPSETGVSQVVTGGTGGTTDTGATNNGATNNGATNNGATNNGATNNGATNSGATNNGATNNGATNNGATNNGATNNGVTNNGGPTVNSPTNGATSGTTGTGQNCDPNTGVCSPAGGSTTGTGGTGNTGDTPISLGGGAVSGSGQQANDTPITLAGSNGNGVEVTLMALAAGMMFLLSVVPPLLAQAGRRSRQRRGIDEFYDDNEWPGDHR
jgi:ABC-type phosphate transport system substrate-binding protein